jgi:two-component system chemotaxis response regulator CheY
LDRANEKTGNPLAELFHKHPGVDEMEDIARRAEREAARRQRKNAMPLDVLVVDDSAAIRKILQRVLAQTELPLGTILEAGDGLEAIERLKTNNIGLVLSDINMPNMDGIELLTRIRENPEWKSIPVVMITTEGSQQKVLEAVDLGAAGYVRKPFTADQIKEKLVGLV